MDMKLNENSMTPLYRQVLEDIKAGIMSGLYEPGHKIPSEAELSEMYDVSRVTVRRAIEQLSREGFLTSRQGKGTYVNHGILAEKLHQPVDQLGLAETCNRMGMHAGVRVMGRRTMPASSEHRAVFGDQCDSVVEMVCVHTANEVPIFEEETCLPLEGFSFLLDASLEGTSSFDLVREHTGREVSGYSENMLEIAAAGAKLAKELGINAGDPLFMHRVVMCDKAGAPLCMSERYAVGTRCTIEL